MEDINFIHQVREAIRNQFDELKVYSKTLLSVKDLSKYLDISEGYIHKMTHNREIPFYKPNGKKLYFKRDEIDQWVINSKVLTQEELRKESRRLGRNIAGQ